MSVRFAMLLVLQGTVGAQKIGRRPKPHINSNKYTLKIGLKLIQKIVRGIRVLTEMYMAGDLALKNWLHHWPHSGSD